MKVNRKLIFIIVPILLATLGVGLVSAGAYDTSFTTSITYQNVGNATAQLQVSFFSDPTDTTPTVVSLPDLAKGAGSSVFIGNLNEVNPGFRGTAILSSDQPIVATLVQIPQGSTSVKVRPLSNGFSDGDDTALIATFLKKTFSHNSVLYVQNVDTVQNDVTVKFYNTSASLVYTHSESNVESGAGFFIDAGLESGLGSSFDGSAVVEAERNDSSPGNVIGSVMELQITGSGGKAFESVAEAGTQFYMPTALCNAFGGANTAYAVQNSSLTNSTNVTVEYSNGLDETKNLGPGSKASFVACDVLSGGFSGSATISSDSQPVVAIGKAYGIGLSTAFLGAASGEEILALPYVRFTSNGNYVAGVQQRVNLAIQNVGGGTVNDVKVYYVNSAGVVDGTHTIASILSGAKANSNAANAGLTEFGNPNSPSQSGYGGGVIIVGPSGSELVVVARVTTCVASSGGTCSSAAGEDYNGVGIATSPVP